MSGKPFRICYRRKQFCFSLSCLLLVCMTAVNLPAKDIVKLISPKDYVFLCLKDLRRSLPSQTDGVSSQLSLSVSREGAEILSLRADGDSEKWILSCDKFLGDGSVGIEKTGVQLKPDGDDETFRTALSKDLTVKKVGSKSFGASEGWGGILDTDIYELSLPKIIAKQLLQQLADAAGDGYVKKTAQKAREQLTSDVTADLYIDCNDDIIGAGLRFTCDGKTVYAELVADDFAHRPDHLSFTCIIEAGKGDKTTLYINSQGDHDWDGGTFTDQTSLKLYHNAFLFASANASAEMQKDGAQGTVTLRFDAKLVGLTLKTSSEGTFEDKAPSAFCLNCQVKTSARETLAVSLNYAEKNGTSGGQKAFRSLGSVLGEESLRTRVKDFLIGNEIAT